MSSSAALGCLPHVFSRRRRRLGHDSLRKREDTGAAGSTIATLCCDISPLSCSSSPPLGIVEVSLNCAETPGLFSPEKKLLLHAASTPAANTEEECFTSSSHSGVPAGTQDFHGYAGSSLTLRAVRCNSAAKPFPPIKNSLRKLGRKKTASPFATATNDATPMHWTSDSAVPDTKPSATQHNNETFTQNCEVTASQSTFLLSPESVLPPEEQLVTPSSHRDPAKEKCSSSSSTPFSLFMRLLSSPERRRRNVPPPGGMERRSGEDEESSTISSPLLAEEIDQELKKMGAPVLGDEECILRSDLTCFIDCRTLQLMDEGDEHMTQL